MPNIINIKQHICLALLQYLKVNSDNKDITVYPIKDIE